MWWGESHGDKTLGQGTGKAEEHGLDMLRFPGVSIFLVISYLKLFHIKIIGEWGRERQ